MYRKAPHSNNSNSKSNNDTLPRVKEERDDMYTPANLPLPLPLPQSFSRNSTTSQLRSLGPPLLLLLIPQQPPENLAAGALGHLVDELDPALEPLVPRLVLLDVFGHVARHHAVRVLEADGWRLDHKRLWHFALALRRDADDDAVVDGRVREDVRFEFGGRDLETLCVKRTGCVSEGLLRAILSDAEGLVTFDLH